MNDRLSTKLIGIKVGYDDAKKLDFNLVNLNITHLDESVFPAYRNYIITLSMKSQRKLLLEASPWVRYRIGAYRRSPGILSAKNDHLHQAQGINLSSPKPFPIVMYSIRLSHPISKKKKKSFLR